MAVADTSSPFVRERLRAVMITALLTMVASVAALQPVENFKDLHVVPQVQQNHRVNRNFGERLTGPQTGDLEAIGINYVHQLTSKPTSTKATPCPLHPPIPCAPTFTTPLLAIGQDWQVTDSYANNMGVQHVYLRQAAAAVGCCSPPTPASSARDTWAVASSPSSELAHARHVANGIPISNALANINVDPQRHALAAWPWCLAVPVASLPGSGYRHCLQGRVINMGHSEFNSTAKVSRALTSFPRSSTPVFVTAGALPFHYPRPSPSPSRLPPTLPRAARVAHPHAGHINACPPASPAAPSARPSITPADALRAFATWVSPPRPRPCLELSCRGCGESACVPWAGCRAPAVPPSAAQAGYSMERDSAVVNVGNGKFAMGPTDAAMENMTASLCYTRTGGADDHLVLTWDISPVFTPDGHHAVNAFVGQDGTVVQAHDWIAHSTYDAFEIPELDPLFGRRKEGIESPEDLAGWNDMDRPADGKGAYTTTKGNNVYAQDNPSGGSSWENNYRPDGGDDLKYAGEGFEINYNQEPVEYKAAAIGNLFYWNNVIHDIFYKFGFDEKGGNFQETNFEESANGQNDAVQANGQDGGGYNNANFYTPANGQRPRMRMYLWNQVRPMHDGDLDSGIIIHEYAHGISNRLTGGPTNVGCLGNGQSGGMGEGWGDWFATAFQQTSVASMENEWPMGEYAAGRGIRPFPYSSQFSANPQTFTYITQSGYSGVHAKGSVWCQILHQVMYHMIQVEPLDADWYSGKGGNGKLLHAVTMGMALQPCRPNFVEARDAILEALEVIDPGNNELKCAAWRGFAQRGMGVDASTNGSAVEEDFNVPSTC
eukprot:gene1900-2970_t